jgi:TetR/AcrR family transcriptional repressor of nem operon
MGRKKHFVPDCVIDKAIGVFMSRGYEATSVKDLVDATGVHPGSLYNAFGSKKRMFETALDRFDAISPFHGLLDRAERENISARETIAMLFEGIVRPVREPGGYESCLITSAAAELGKGNPALARRLQASFDQMELRLCELVGKGQATGEIASKRSAQDLGRFLFSVMQGMTLLAKLNDDRSRLAGAAETAMAALD